MKTATITLHDTDNCGSTLQAYALQKFLYLNGVENEIIDYKPSYVHNNGSFLRTLLRKIIYWKDSYIRSKKISKFKSENLKLSSSSFKTGGELYRNPPKADCYITGSDQLWNSMFSCGKDACFYLDFIKSKSKIAYAISMGRDYIPEDNIELVKKYVKDFKWISVREKSSVEQLEKALNRNDIQYVCDPVFLNPKEVYDGIIKQPVITGAYVLIYIAQRVDRKFLDNLVKKLSPNRDRKIVFVGTYRNKCACDIHLRDVSPDEFVGLISNADYVISNSFHATVFSILYHKQFVTLLPEENGTRIKELLILFGLEKHAVNNMYFYPDTITEEKFNCIDEILKEFRVNSGSLLLKEIYESSKEIEL